MDQSRSLFVYFRLFNTVDSKQMFDKSFMMTGFKPRISGVGGDWSTNWAKPRSSIDSSGSYRHFPTQRKGHLLYSRPQKCSMACFRDYLIQKLKQTRSLWLTMSFDVNLKSHWQLWSVDSIDSLSGTIPNNYKFAHIQASKSNLGLVKQPSLFLFIFVLFTIERQI